MWLRNLIFFKEATNVSKSNAKRAKRANRQNPRVDRNSNVVNFPNNKQKQIQLVPRSVSQEDYIDALNDDTCSIVVAAGPAGGGKTWLATLAALKAYMEGDCEKIVISRPNRATDDEGIGHLPGDIIEKMVPWMKPILDVLSEHYPMQQLKKMIEDEVIEICPLPFIRGRTFKNAWVLVDEAQNTTPNSMKSALTRLGENCKMVVTGDVEQSDIGKDNGLNDLLQRYNNKKGTDTMTVVEFSRKDVVRSQAVKDVLGLYE